MAVALGPCTVEGRGHAGHAHFATRGADGRRGRRRPGSQAPHARFLQAAGRVDVPSFVDPLIARMTLEEKAGQLQLMAAAWGGGAALSLNPPGSGSNFDSRSKRRARVS